MNKPLKDKEKLVRDLVNTFNDRDELHVAYKQKMKDIIAETISEFIVFLAESQPDDDQMIADWIDNFVEERFKPSED